MPRAHTVSGASLERLAETCVRNGWRLGITADYVQGRDQPGMVMSFLEVRDVALDPPELLAKVRCATRGEIDKAVEQAEECLRVQRLLL